MCEKSIVYKIKIPLLYSLKRDFYFEKVCNQSHFINQIVHQGYAL